MSVTTFLFHSVSISMLYSYYCCHFGHREASPCLVVVMGWISTGHGYISVDITVKLLECLFNRLFRRRSRQTSTLRVAGLCEGNSPVTGELPSLRASNAGNVSIWWRHHHHGNDAKCRRHLNEIFISGCTWSCHFDNFQCSQWWKFCQNNISVSVHMLTFIQNKSAN